MESAHTSEPRFADNGVDRRCAVMGLGGALIAAMAAPAATATPATPAQGDTAAHRAPVQSGPAGRSATATLAAYATATRLDAVPPAVVERAKKVIFDETACAFFGRSVEAGTIAARYVAQFGGPPEARIYGTDLRAPAAFAAMANGTAGHGYEVDGTHVIGGHPGASIVHACTAAAERQHASGAELINAVVLGYDVGVRLVEACGGKFVVRDTKHLTSDQFYALGATTAVARILRLDGERHCHALALASFQVNGLAALYDEKRHMSKSFCNGQYAYAGNSAPLLAQAGLEGNEDIIGAKDGLLDAWGVPADRAAATRDLGRVYKIMGANFKFSNAGYPIHTAVEAALTLAREHAISNEAIESITVGMPAAGLKTVNNREMHDISVQDMVVANLVRGGLKLSEEPFPALLSDPMFARLRSRITAQVDPELEREFPDGRGARVTIKVRGGGRYTARIDNPLGHSLRGEVSWDDLAAKWRGSLEGCDLPRAIAAAQRLETLPNAAAFFAAFAGKNPTKPHNV